MSFGKKAVELDPKDEDFAIIYAGLLEQDGKYEEALETLRPMLEREPPVFGAVLTFGNFASLIGMKDQAQTLIKSLKQANGLTGKQKEDIIKSLHSLKDQI